MEDDLKISKVEYLSNNWLHLTNILKLNNTKLYEYFKWRWNMMPKYQKWNISATKHEEYVIEVTIRQWNHMKNSL